MSCCDEQCIPTCAPNIIHTYKGRYEVYLTTVISPTSYTTVGQVLVVSYTIENKGTLPLCKKVRICDSLAGENCYQCVDIQPCCSQTFTTSYTITASDVTLPSLNSTSIAYVQVKKKDWVKSNCSIQTISHPI